MTWAPISKVVPQWVDTNGNPYSGAVLKAYSAGTATNIPMATSSTGGTTATSIALNSDGYPEVSGNIVIPHINEDYKLALYPTQAAADADSGAIWNPDNLPKGSVYNSITGYSASELKYVESDVGADSTSFDIDANIGAAWEELGPTGSGATNIWTALDNLPSGATWIRLKVLNDCDDSTGANIAQYVYGRATGSATAVGDQTLISSNRLTITGSGATASGLGPIISYPVIPVDSGGSFDLYFTSSGTSRDITCWLVDFG